VNRQEVFTTTVKAPMLRAYGHNENQANDSTQDSCKTRRKMPGLLPDEVNKKLLIIIKVRVLKMLQQESRCYCTWNDQHY
jgi:hypothetical protein